MTREKGIFNAFTLKMIMAALMLLDHIHYFLPPQPDWFTYLGRLVAPTFCYLMTQSLAHTRNRGRFIRRMAVAGFIMLGGSTLLWLRFDKFIGNTIFLSLALGAAIVDRIERLQKGGAGAARVVELGLLYCLCIFVEGGPLIPVMAVIFYFLRERKLLMCAAYVAGASALSYLLGYPEFQLLQAFALVPILLYNGKRGPDNVFARWFFYIFYPIHIWILYVVSQLRI